MRDSFRDSSISSPLSHRRNAPLHPALQVKFGVQTTNHHTLAASLSLPIEPFPQPLDIALYDACSKTGTEPEVHMFGSCSRILMQSEATLRKQRLWQRDDHFCLLHAIIEYLRALSKKAQFQSKASLFSFCLWSLN